VRITGLSIDGFGLFHDTEIRDLAPGLNLVLGNNEAGKSTAMGFVHAILFGFADGRSRDASYPPLRGGQHGGRLSLETDLLGGLTVERLPGPKGGRCAIQADGGRPLGAADLERVLGGVNSKLYRTLYGFSLSELQSFESIASEEVRDVIYGASLGTGLRTLPEARKELSKRAEGLFKAGGKKPEINKLLQNLEATRAELREAQHGLQRFQETNQKIDTLDREIEEGRAVLLALRERAERTRSLLAAWESWQGLRDARRALGELEPRVERFPEQGLERLTTFEGRLKVQRDELEQARRTLAKQRGELRQLVYDAALVEHGVEVAELLQGIDAYDQAERDLPTAQRVASEKDEDAGAVRTELGSSWSEERALGLDRSTHSRESIGGYRTRLDESEGTEREHARALEAAEAAASEAKAKCAALELALAVDDSANLDVEGALAQQLRDGRATFAGVVRDLPRRREDRRDLQEALHVTLREIDPSWTVETLDSLDTSLQSQRRIEDADEAERAGSEALRAARERRDRAAADLRKIDTRLDADRQAFEDRGHAVGESGDAHALVERRTRGLALRKEAQQLTHDRIELEALRARQSDARRPTEFSAETGLRGKLAAIAGIVVAVGLIGGTAFLATGETAGAALIGVGAALVAGLLLWLRSSAHSATTLSAGPTTDLRAAIAELEHRLEALTKRIAGALRDLGFDPSLATHPETDLVATIEARADELADLTRLAEGVAALSVERLGAQGDLEAVDEVVVAADQALNEQRARWREHARSLSLPEDTSPRTATLVFGKAEKARSEQQRIQDVDRRIETMEVSSREFREVIAQVPRLALQLGLDDDGVLVELNGFLAEIDESEAQRQERARLRDQLTTAEELAATAEEHRAIEEAAVEVASAQLEQAREEWAAWLDSVGMEPGWSPDTALHALGRAARLFELVRDRDEQTARAEELGDQIGRYRERASSLFAELGRATPTQRHLLLEIRRLGEERETNDGLRSRHVQLSKTVAETEEQIRDREQTIGDLERDLAALLDEADCRGSEEFRTRGGAHGERLVLEARIEEQTNNIRRTTDVEDLSEVEPELAGTNQDKLAALRTVLEEQVESADREAGERREERGKADQERTSLHSEDRVSKLRATEESLREQLDQRAREWARYSIAEHLLDVAKERHAKANQPQVIQEAGRYFELITGGRYTRVFAPPGEGKIEVVDAEGRSKQAEDLSRGSAEQLYLAIRFGYIAAQVAASEPLPVLMDDVLVNFDPQRAGAAAKAIVTLSHERQVVFFTCHPKVVETFREHAPDAALYRIDKGQLLTTAE